MNIMDFNEFKRSRFFIEIFDKSISHANHKYPYILLFIPLCMATVFSLLYIGDKCYWIDEALTVRAAGLSWSGLWELISSYEANMGLYYVLLKLWIRLGESESIVRELSAVFSILCVPMIYALGKRLFNSDTALAAAFLLAVNAFFIRYAQEVRAYSLHVLLVTVSSYYFVRLIENPNWKIAIGYILTSVLAVYSHFFGLLYLMGHGISLLFLPKNHYQGRKFSLIAISIVILLTPIWYFLLTKSSDQLDWVRSTSMKDIYYFFINLTGERVNNWFGDSIKGKYLFIAYLFPAIITMIAGMFSLLESRRSIRTWCFMFLFIWLFFPVTCVYFYSITFSPMFVYRYMIGSIIPVVLMAGYGVASIKNRAVSLIYASLLIALSVHSLFTSYYPRQKPDWMSATRFVMSEAKTGDAILFYAWTCKAPFEIYCRNMNYPCGSVLKSLYPSPFGIDTLTPIQNPGLQFMDSLKDEYDRIWVVLSETNHPKIGRDSRYVMGPLQKHYKVEESRDFTGIKIRLLKRIPL